ncbi:hypothetical protein ACFYXC_38785 [Streptomyces sp. NPDC002701]|uniref:hypothetical protein n=1 Tax=Streptomyces sp. NPDC002701 TaxID=3364661 RepID=UPI0036CC10D1
MRALVSRGLLLPPLVCAALVLGPVGAAAAVDAHPGSPDARATARELSAADLTPERLGLPAGDERAAALAPLLTALGDLAERGKGPLDAAEADEHAQAVEDATASLQQRVREMVGSATAKGTATKGTAAEGAAVDDFTPADAELGESVETLIGSLLSLDVPGVVDAVPDLLSSVLGLLTGGSGSRSTNLSSLPTT